MKMPYVAATTMALVFSTGCATTGESAQLAEGTLAREGSISERVGAELHIVDHRLAQTEERCRGPDGAVRPEHRYALRELKKKRAYVRQRLVYLQRRYEPGGLLREWQDLEARVGVVSRELDALASELEG